jgi:uncharacterized protein (TIGR02246 family)
MALALALGVVLVAVIAIAIVARGSDATASQATRVRELDQTLRQALVAGDADAVDRILAPDVELVDPAGDKETRDQYLGSVSSGDLTYQTFDPISPVEVRISGDVAVVTYESQLAVSAGAVDFEHKAWHTHLYEKRDGRWRQVWSQATAVGGFPPPGA